MIDINRLVEICGESSTELPHGLTRQQRRDWARKNMERIVVKMDFTAEQKANCFVTLKKARELRKGRMAARGFLTEAVERSRSGVSDLSRLYRESER